MKVTELPAAKNGAAAQNGARAVSSASAAAPRKRSQARATPRNAASTQPVPQLAPFAAIPSEPRDTEMWTLTPVLWLQPELCPVIPASSGLTIERRCTVPGADFLYRELVPAGGVPAPAGPGNGLPPQLPQQLPQSNLAPLGWDPRALPRPSGKGGDA